MLEKFWPWGQQSKPRGLRNLRLEGLFPHTDHKKVTDLCVDMFKSEQLICFMLLASRLTMKTKHYRRIFLCSSVPQSVHSLLYLF